MKPAIRVEKLSKQYRLGVRNKNVYPTLREALARAVRAPLRRRQPPEEQSETFWALKDVSFELQPGEVLGIIGQNGAGKSTLLKILTRVVEPTAGRVEMRGRMGSLLEVGTGFHPELTGRENVYLNGSFLGMTRKEIDRKFDEIVAFSEVEKFLDTPVKRYSSGMYVRLAFAVAAHLDPEILIVDEVLAVGDIAFQRKCLGVMHDASAQGRTVLFVSHSIPAVRSLCDTAIRLHNGQLLEKGPSESVINKYVRDMDSNRGKDPDDVIPTLPPDPSFRLLDIRISQGGTPSTTILSGEPLDITIRYDVFEVSPGLHLVIKFFDTEDVLLFETLERGDEAGLPVVLPGRYSSKVTIPAGFLAPRTYEIALDAGIHNIRHFFPHLLRIRIDVEPSGMVNRAYPGYVTPGRLAPLLQWNLTHRPLPSSTG
jgi:lipopolysaccharide transport system ATP-binding protein